MKVKNKIEKEDDYKLLNFEEERKYLKTLSKNLKIMII